MRYRQWFRDVASVSQLLLMLDSCRACMHTIPIAGYLDNSLEIRAVTLTNQPGTCACCGLCYSDASCASFSYNEWSKECKLYSAVAGYDTFVPDGSGFWKYLVMPGRSGHHQFCRSDSDCTEGGEFCRGSVCTALSAITCRVIRDVLGAEERLGRFLHLPGWLNNKTLTLACMMGAPISGATRIFKIRAGHAYTEETLWYYNAELELEDENHSILRLAEDLRQLGTDSSYQLFLYTYNGNSRITFEIPREEPVIGSAPRPDVGTISTTFGQSLSGFQPGLPHYVTASDGNTMLSIRDDVGGGNIHWYEGVFARRDGRLGYWAGFPSQLIYMYILE